MLTLPPGWGCADDSFCFGALHDLLFRQSKVGSIATDQLPTVRHTDRPRLVQAGLATLPDLHPLNRIYLIPIDGATASKFGINGTERALFSVVVPRSPVQVE